MQNYHFRLSVRVWHPSMEPELITRALNLAPNRQCRVGDPRSTPRGQRLDGLYAETYWYADLDDDAPINSNEKCLEDAVSEAVSRLQSASGFLQSVRESKGRAELFVGLYGRWNYGLEFSPELLANVAGLGLALSLDIYPNIESP